MPATSLPFHGWLLDGSAAGVMAALIAAQVSILL
jgi:hypothetical protein